MDDLPSQEPIKVYENTYIMQPDEQQRCVAHMLRRCRRVPPPPAVSALLRSPGERAGGCLA